MAQDKLARLKPRLGVSTSEITIDGPQGDTVGVMVVMLHAFQGGSDDLQRFQVFGRFSCGCGLWKVCIGRSWDSQWGLQLGRPPGAAQRCRA